MPVGLDTGIRTLFLSKSGSDSNTGVGSAAQARLTWGAILPLIEPGDILRVGDGLYNEQVTLSNFDAAEGFPLRIVAENEGQAILGNLWQEAFDATQVWTDLGGGTFSAARTERPFAGEHNGDFLLHYRTRADLEAASVNVFSGIEGANIDVSKPDYGFAFENDTVFIRLRGAADPNGQVIKLTADFSSTLLTLDNANNVIVEGIRFEGSGASPGVLVNTDCQNFTAYNCLSRLTRFGFRVPTNTILKRCDYALDGYDTWKTDLLALDGAQDKGDFVLGKSYFTNDIRGGSASDALLEGGLRSGFDVTQSNVLVDECKMGPAFEGDRQGEFDNSETRLSVFVGLSDDGSQEESTKTTNKSSGNQTHDCRFIDAFVSLSHQGSFIDGSFHAYRNVFEFTNAALFRSTLYFIKMLQTPASGFIQYYHNLFLRRSDVSDQDQWIWYDFSNGTGNRLRNFLNNVVMFEQNLDNGAGPNPVNIQGNAVVAPSSGDAAFLTVGGGAFAGTAEADMDLDADFVPNVGSPARNIGVPLPAGFPDSRTGIVEGSRDAGPFQFGELPGANWPRSSAVEFDTVNLPPRWTSPGGGGTPTGASVKRTQNLAEDQGLGLVPPALSDLLIAEDTDGEPVSFTVGQSAALLNQVSTIVPATNIKSLGAVGNNSANDTAAFQEAADSGLTYYVPPGDYRVDPINVPALNPGRFIGASSFLCRMRSRTGNDIFRVRVSGDIGDYREVDQGSPVFANLGYIGMNDSPASFNRVSAGGTAIGACGMIFENSNFPGSNIDLGVGLTYLPANPYIYNCSHNDSGSFNPLVHFQGAVPNAHVWNLFSQGPGMLCHMGPTFVRRVTVNASTNRFTVSVGSNPFENGHRVRVISRRTSGSQPGSVSNTQVFTVISSSGSSFALSGVNPSSNGDDVYVALAEEGAGLFENEGIFFGAFNEYTCLDGVSMINTVGGIIMGNTSYVARTIFSAIDWPSAGEGENQSLHVDNGYSESPQLVSTPALLTEVEGRSVTVDGWQYRGGAPPNTGRPEVRFDVRNGYISGLFGKSNSVTSNSRGQAGNQPNVRLNGTNILVHGNNHEAGNLIIGDSGEVRGRLRNTSGGGNHLNDYSNWA